MKYFIHDRITHDEAWRGIKIYLSGHETPGEGEHKIMEYIRHQRTLPDHDPRTRHCLYGRTGNKFKLSQDLNMKARGEFFEANSG